MNLLRNPRAFLCSIALLGAGLSVTAQADTFTWNNTGTDFNAAGSWTNSNPLGPAGPPDFNDLAAFDSLKVSDPTLTAGSATAIFGLRFGTLGSGYTLSSTSGVQLAIGAGGISASNTTGTNTITAPLVLNDDESITQAAGGTLNITGPMTLGSGTGTTTITIGTTSGNGTINFTPSTVQIGNNIALVTHVDATFGAISPSAAVGEAPTAGITKSGAGTLTFTGGNTYGGATIINGGTLEANASGGNKALGSTSGVVVNSGGTLLTTSADQFGGSTPLSLSGGTFNTAGTSQTLGALTLTSSSTIDLASGSSIISFGGTSTRTGGTLTIDNWSGSQSGGGTDQLLFANALDPTFLGNINFTGFTPGAVQLQSGEIVPAPEPASWIGAAIALAAVAYGRLVKRLRVAG